jgi:hypothetical protein
MLRQRLPPCVQNHNFFTSKNIYNNNTGNQGENLSLFALLFVLTRALVPQTTAACLTYYGVYIYYIRQSSGHGNITRLHGLVAVKNITLITTCIKIHGNGNSS